MYYMLIAYGYGYGYGYDHGLYEIHDENVGWTYIPNLIRTCETLLTQM